MKDMNYSDLIQAKKNDHKYSKIDKFSHYVDPIEFIPGRLYGNSRIPGDASNQVQSEAIDNLIIESKKAGLTQTQTAHILLIASTASGFNPNTARLSDSAYGLGQLTDDIAQKYGITEHDKDDINKQSSALINYYQDNLNKDFSKDEMLLSFAKLLNIDLSKTNIELNINKYEKFIKKYNKNLTNSANSEKQIKQKSTKNTPTKTSQHALHLNKQIELLCRKRIEEMHINWDEGMEKTVFALTVVAVENKFNNVTHLGLSDDNKTIHIADIGDICSIYGELNTAIAAQTPKNNSLEQIEKIESQQPQPQEQTNAITKENKESEHQIHHHKTP